MPVEAQAQGPEFLKSNAETQLAAQLYHLVGPSVRDRAFENLRSTDDWNGQETWRILYDGCEQRDLTRFMEMPKSILKVSIGVPIVPRLAAWERDARGYEMQSQRSFVGPIETFDISIAIDSCVIREHIAFFEERLPAYVQLRRAWRWARLARARRTATGLRPSRPAPTDVSAADAKTGGWRAVTTGARPARPRVLPSERWRRTLALGSGHEVVDIHWGGDPSQRLLQDRADQPNGGYGVFTVATSSTPPKVS